MRIRGGGAPPSKRTLVARPAFRPTSMLRQRAGEILNSTAARQRGFSFQAAISQFSGSIYVIDLAGNRCLIPSSSVTPFVPHRAARAAGSHDPADCQPLLGGRPLSTHNATSTGRAWLDGRG